tara:strand:- start:6110 stop:7216 length:1107 start_codon:yes stop_codon:yes gene_type:complete
MTDGLEPQRTSLDTEEIHNQLTTWFQNKVSDPNASISQFSRPSGSGMSSETLLFLATWENEEGRHERELVARLAPTSEDIPVFPSYDLLLQTKVMRIVGEHTAVPVPKTLWLERSPEVLGVPFFVMEKVIGRVPPDIPPYVFGGWLHDAVRGKHSTLERSAVNIIAEISQIDLANFDTSFLELQTPGETALERHFSNQMDYYYWVVGNQRRHPVIESAAEWLQKNWPEESKTVLSWGDARIGNIMFGLETFKPVAVLDWEMAGLAPVEVDLGWMVFLHKFFQNIAEAFEFKGMPQFMDSKKVSETYSELTGRIPNDLLWFEIYAGMRHAIIMSRINDRSVRFGETEWTDDVDSVIPHRELLWSMMSGR